LRVENYEKANEEEEKGYKKKTGHPSYW